MIISTKAFRTRRSNKSSDKARTQTRRYSRQLKAQAQGGK